MKNALTTAIPFSAASAQIRAPSSRNSPFSLRFDAEDASAAAYLIFSLLAALILSKTALTSILI